MYGMKMPEEIAKLDVIWEPYWRGVSNDGKEVLWAADTPKEAIEAHKKSCELYDLYTNGEQ